MVLIILYIILIGERIYKKEHFHVITIILPHESASFTKRIVLLYKQADDYIHLRVPIISAVSTLPLTASIVTK